MSDTIESLRAQHEREIEAVLALLPEVIRTVEGPYADLAVSAAKADRVVQSLRAQAEELERARDTAYADGWRAGRDAAAKKADKLAEGHALRAKEWSHELRRIDASLAEEAQFACLELADQIRALEPGGNEDE